MFTEFAVYLPVLVIVQQIEGLFVKEKWINVYKPLVLVICQNL